MKTRLILTLIALTLLQGCTQAAGQSNQNYVKTQIIKRTALEDTIELTGSIEGRTQTTLSAKTPGRIERVYFEVGDTVSQGDVIIQLSGEEAAVNLETSANAYDNALSNLETTGALMDTQIVTSEKNIDTLTVRIEALNNTRKSTDEITARQVNLAEEQVKLVETRIENIKRSLNKTDEDLQDQKARLITNATILTKSNLDGLYAIFDIHEGNLKNGFTLDNRFGQTSSRLKRETEDALIQLQSDVSDLKAFYDEIIKPGNYTDDQINEGFDKARQTLDSAKSTLETTHDLLLNTISSYLLPQNELDRYRNNVAQMGAEIESMILSVSGGTTIGFEGLSQSETGLDVERTNQLAEYESQLQIAKQQLDLAEETRNQQLSDIDNNIQILESQLAEAQIGKESSVANKDAQIQMQKTQADQAKGQFDMAKVAYENTIVRAPSDGIIMDKLIDEGTVVSAGMPLVEFADNGVLKIETEVSDEMLKSLNMGMPASFTIDSINDKDFTAEVTQIGEHADSITHKIPVELEIIGETKDIRIGAYARIKIVTDVKLDVIAVPYEAILEDAGGEYVFTVVNGTAHKQIVNTGQRFLDAIEIQEGLKVGDEVILSGMELLEEGDSVAIIND